MKIFIIILCLSVSAFTQDEDYQDEFGSLEAYNNKPNETNHQPEIEENYEEAYNNKPNETNENYEEAYNNKPNETNQPEIEDNYEEATFYRPNTWDFWIMNHIIETVLWSILLLMTISIIGLACCLFDLSHLFFSLLMNEAEPQIIPLQTVPVQHVRFQV